MLQWLIRRTIPNYQEVERSQVRTAYGKFSSIFGIICNLLLFAAKFIAGTVAGSVSIRADAINNLSDASSSIISLVGFQMADRPADEEHPFGHGRYEYLSGLMVAVLILVIGLELGKSSLDKILHPQAVEFHWLTAVILVGSILIKAWMMAANRKIGRLIDSQTLLAVAADSRNDIITTGVVLLSALISHFTSVELDGWMGLAVAIFILVNGFSMVQDTISPMLGRAPDAEWVEEIRQKILSYPGVLGTHDLMVHDYGPGRQFASVHVEMAAEADALESHEVIDKIEQDFWQEDHLHLVVHYDPIVTNDAVTNDLRYWLMEQVQQIDPRLSIHDLRLIPGNKQTRLLFDCVVPHELPMKLSDLQAEIVRRIHEKDPQYNCVITFDSSFAPVSHK